MSNLETIGVTAGRDDRTLGELVAELRERVVVGGGYADVSGDELERLICADWHLIETAPKDGSFIWLSDGFFMRVGYWYVVTADPSQEHWADLIGRERGDLGDLPFTPTHWQRLPGKPIPGSAA